jgi:hypothetical protein
MTTATDSRARSSACRGVTLNAFWDHDKTNWTSTKDSVKPHATYIGISLRLTGPKAALWRNADPAMIMATGMMASQRRGRKVTSGMS